jgi:hypothetical protein
MKLLKYFFSLVLLSVVIFSCNKNTFDDVSFLNSDTAPAKASVLFDITQDNTGLVTITPNGEGANTFDVYYGDATTAPAKVAAGKNTQHTYAEGVYTVKVVAYSATGKTTTITQSLTVSFRAPENLAVTAAIDASNIFKVNVSATAIYQTVFKVYYGDVPNEVPVSLLQGQTVSHVYAAVGTYTVTVVALSGGAATTTVTKTITIVNPVLLPIDFESATVNYAWNDFGGGAVTVINNPKSTGIDVSAKVAKMVKSASQVYGGSSIHLGGNINFSTNKYLHMKVYSPRVGAKVLLKAEDAANGATFYQKEVATTMANAWEDMTFDFTGVSTSLALNTITLIFDNGTMGDGSANFTFYMDDIRLDNVPAASALLSLPVTFDVAGVNYAVTDFGSNITIDAVDPTNAANKVKKTTKPNGAQTWAGTTLGTTASFASKVPFTASATQMSVRVYSPAAGIHVRLKVEDHADGTKSVETEAITTVANTWETLVFDFSSAASGTPVLNLAYNYDKCSIFFDFNTAGNGKVFYWDDVTFLPPVAGLVLPLTFEQAISYPFTDFNGGGVTIINNPQSSGINTSAKVGKMVKSAGATYGGSFITLDNPINFSTKKTFTVKVFSPRVGAKLLLKVENLTNGGISYQQEVATTTANAWELLTFNFSGIDATLSYQKVVLIFDNGTVGDGSANYTFYFDDITLN